MEWQVGQTVDVQSRTWAGINKPGGCAKITQVHYTADGLTVESIDVKYVLGGGFEKEIDPVIVSPFETLERGGRKRRGREFLMDRADTVVKKVKQAIRKNAAKNATSSVTLHNTTTARRPQVKSTKEPDQSTSPSTPITPEHPSVSKAKSSKTGTGSVPSFVIADRAVEVSPLPLDRAVMEPKKSTVARRGLFGCSGPLKANTSTDQNETKVAAKPSAPVKKATHSSTSEDSTFHKTARDVSRAHSAAMMDSMTMKQGRNFSNKFGAKKMPLADRKPASKPSVEATEAHRAGSSNKTSLKNVFDYELRKAKEFLDEVCRVPCNEIVDKIDPASKENRLNTSASEGEEDIKPAANNRREEFLDLFRTLRPRFDDDDGTMEEAAFRILVDRRASKPFTLKEVDDNLDFLYQEGKLMKSDGILYIID